MTEIQGRTESEHEVALREWFREQTKASPDNLEAAARLLIGLVTGLLGVLFGVLALAAKTPPAYLQLLSVRWAGVSAIVFLLLGLMAALVVVLPARLHEYPGRPDKQREQFAGLLLRKSRALLVAIGAFAAGLVALGAVLILALVNV